MICPISLSDENKAVLIAGILIVTITLRVTFTGVTLLLDMTRFAYPLTTTQTGLLTTLLLLVFTPISPLVAPVAWRLGVERSLSAALLLVCAGIIARSLPSPYLLFGGTTVVSSGITLGNVLLPGLVKRDFPHSVVRPTGIYSLIMEAAAVLGLMMVTPLALNDLDWQGALLMLICSPLLTLFLRLPQWWNQQHANLSTSRVLHTRDIWHSPLAWQVTLFLGINLLVYYMAIGRPPTILISHGYSEAQAGSLHSLLQLATAAPDLLIPLFLHHAKDRRGIVAFVALMCAMDAAGLYFMPAHAITWTLLFGFGSGVTMVLGLAFIGLRASFAHQVAVLSGTAQSVGCLLVVCGLSLMGKIYNANGDWSVSLLGVVILSLLMTIFGLCTGRDKETR